MHHTGNGKRLKWIVIRSDPVDYIPPSPASGSSGAGESLKEEIAENGKEGNYAMRESVMNYLTGSDFFEKRLCEAIHYNLSCGGNEGEIDRLIMEVWRSGYNAAIHDMKKVAEKLPGCIN